MTKKKRYNSRVDTWEHIHHVRDCIEEISGLLWNRGYFHDRTKLESPEVELFDEFTPKLSATTYGSEEYKQHLAEMGPALQHHYEHNSHHPEHHPNGVDDMTLLDVIEMFCDWKAATLRHTDGNFQKSLEINADRFELSDQLAKILENTRKELNW